MNADHLPTLDSVPVTHILEIPKNPSAAIDALSVPPAPAVVVFEGADGRTVLIATTADARALVRKRLGLEAGTEKAKTWRVDYRAITVRVLVIRVASPLEADAVYLAQARVRLPHAHKVVTERWRAWFARVDPEAEFPEWTKTNLLGLVGTRSTSTAKSAGSRDAGVLLGPLPDKDAAGRFIEAVIDTFDLCRYHHLLVQALRASACAYKEMGRCPAPCDGTESMENYRRRTRDAVEMIATGGLHAEIEAAERTMRKAGASGDYELASECKKRAERLRSLDKHAFAHVARLDRWALLIVTRTEQEGWFRLIVFCGERLIPVADFMADRIEDAEPVLLERARALIESAALEREAPHSLETIGLVNRWLFRPDKRRGGFSLRWPVQGATAGSLTQLTKKLKRSGKDDPRNIDDQTIDECG